MAPPFCVYVLDDDDSVRKALSRLLLASGYDVKPYASPERFLEECPREAHGCLILDMTMPRMSGLQTQERLGEMGIILPIIGISASDDNGARERARDLGASFFLQKPIDDQALLDAISWVVGAMKEA
jgi:two-component system response regulator FixJ